MLFNGMTVWRVRVWLFAIAAVLIASHRASDAQRIVVKLAGCPASTTTAVHRFFAVAPQAPRSTACAPRPDQRAMLSRASPIEES